MCETYETNKQTKTNKKKESVHFIKHCVILLINAIIISKAKRNAIIVKTGKKKFKMQDYC